MSLLSELTGEHRFAVPAPYYDDPQLAIELYHEDCYPWLPRMLRAGERIALVLTDPPYGVGENTKRGKAGRGKWASAQDFDPIAGDDTPFDPSPILSLERPTVLWGAEHYADKLPTSPSWIVWDKRDGLQSRRAVGFNDNGDAELAWTNLGGPVRLWSHRWMGALRASEKDTRLPHPTRKPVLLAEWIIAANTKPGDLILDPFMGSGWTAQAAKLLGRRYIGFELAERYLRHTASKLRQSVLTPFLGSGRDVRPVQERIEA